MTTRYLAYIGASVLVILSTGGCSTKPPPTSPLSQIAATNIPTVDENISTSVTETVSDETMTPTEGIIMSSRVSPTQTSAPMTPLPSPKPEDWKFSDDFLFEGQSENCQLPCWHNLRVNESGKDEITTVLEQVIGYEDAEQVFEAAMPSSESEIANLGNLWVLQETPLVTVSINILYNTETQSYRGLLARVHGNRFRQYLTPKQVIREVGDPDYIYMSYNESGEVAEGPVSLIFVYEAGMIFGFEGTGGRYFPSELLEVCFDDSTWANEGYPHGDSGVTILEPFSNGLNQMSELQKAILGNVVDTYIPLFEHEDLQTHDLVAIIGAGQCINLSVPIP